MTTATTPAPSINMRTWSGSASVRITDMEHAGKRGKRCRVLRFQGWFPNGGDAVCERARALALAVRRWAESLSEATRFDDAASQLSQLVARHGALPDHAASVYREHIRGVDAPRPRLTASVEGAWHGQADEDGISLSDDSDPYNEPAACTHHAQANTRAYLLASKVWGQVQACRTMNQAADVLRAVGCRLHYWCRMD